MADGNEGLLMELFRQAAVIMVIGMGLTFLFLYLVILSVWATGLFVRRHEGADAKSAGDAEARDLTSSIAAMAAAIHEHERRGGAGE